MSIPLLDMMTEQVSQQRDGIITRAKQEADAIRQQARERMAAESAEALRQVESELKAAAQRSRERAEAESHMVVMTTKDRVTDEVMGEVRERLQQMAKMPEFSRVIEALLAELLDEAPADGIVLAPPSHVEQCRASVARLGKPGLRVEGLPGLVDGVAVQDAAHTYRITNTLTTRFLHVEPELRKLSVQQLFGKES